jgi:hypothetical protein
MTDDGDARHRRQLCPQRRGGELPHAGLDVLLGAEAERSAVASAAANTCRTSPVRHSRVTTGSRSGATASVSAPAMSSTVRGVPLATLNVPGTGSVSASTLARATSRTRTKSRHWPPSSNTLGTPPAASAERKMLPTPAYGVSRGIRGP